MTESIFHRQGPWTFTWFVVVTICLGALIVAQAPLPAALTSAKRIYLINEAGDLKRFDSFADELQKVKHLRERLDRVK